MMPQAMPAPSAVSAMRSTSTVPERPTKRTELVMAKAMTNP